MTNYQDLIERLRELIPFLVAHHCSAEALSEAATAIGSLVSVLDEIANARWPSVDGDDPVKRIQSLARAALTGGSHDR